MARGGAMTLSDVAGDRLTIACPLCPRRGSYAVGRLIAERGDARLTDFLGEASADCPRRANRDADRCRARYEGLLTRR